MSLREISDATNISVRFLEALENERFDLLPGGIFRRAFVREYARHLGLDAERVVADFVQAQGAPAENPSARARSAPNRGMWVVATLVLLLIPLLAGKIGRERRQPGPPRAALAPAAAAVTRVYSTPAPPRAENDDDEPEPLALTLSAKDACWVAVRADGQTVLNRVLSRGETQIVQAHGELVLSVGNAGGIAFSIDDKPGVSLGRSGEVRRNIVITRKSLPSLVEDTSPASPAHSL